MITELAQVADELSRIYHKHKNSFKKGEKGAFYNKIISNLFDQHGEYFEFKPNELSKFKSVIIKIQKEYVKKQKTKLTNQFTSPKKGDGQISLDFDWQT